MVFRQVFWTIFSRYKLWGADRSTIIDPETTNVMYFMEPDTRLLVFVCLIQN